MRTLGLGTCVIGIVAIMALLDPESGLGIWQELRADLAASKARVARLVRENDAMRREISILEGEPAALDRAIREELDLALPGEVVVRFVDSAAFSGRSESPRSRPFQPQHAFSGESPDRETK